MRKLVQPAMQQAVPHQFSISNFKRSHSENGVLGEDGLGDEADCLGVHLWLSKIGSNLIYSNYWLKWPHIFRGLLKWGGCLNLICR